MYPWALVCQLMPTYHLSKFWALQDAFVGTPAHPPALQPPQPYHFALSYDSVPSPSATSCRRSNLLSFRLEPLPRAVAPLVPVITRPGSSVPFLGLSLVLSLFPLHSSVVCLVLLLARLPVQSSLHIPDKLCYHLPSLGKTIIPLL